VILTFPRLNFDYNCNQTGPLYLTVLIKNDAVDNELNIFCYFTYLNIGLNFVFRAEPKKNLTTIYWIVLAKKGIEIDTEMLVQTGIHHNETQNIYCSNIDKPKKKSGKYRF
jgi:hypothetical protein